jgi:YfiH family protein
MVRTNSINSMFITPTWPAPKNIHAYTTLRHGGLSEKPYDCFNLAQHVGDQPEHVQANRQLLKKELNLLIEPIWLQQTHSTIAVKATPENREMEADASYTNQAHHTCVVLTADCLPLLVCNRDGTHIAAIHAGWRGLLNGVIESTLHALSLPPEELLVWLGPAIGPAHYETGDEVREQFIHQHPNAINAFSPSPNNRWLADLYALARLRLYHFGITAIYGGELCTYADNRFYSYRRDGGKTGRIATLIWISD